MTTDAQERMYHLKVRSTSRSDKWEERSTYQRVTVAALTHTQALTMRSKLSAEVRARTLLVGAETVPACAECCSLECCPEEGWCSRQLKRGGCSCSHGVKS